MSRKRRLFDIEMPEDLETPTAEPTGEVPSGGLRRGPMASAVRENAESLKARAEAEARIREENDTLAHEYVRLQKEGLVLRRVSLDEVRTTKLSRDRRSEDDEALLELKDSIRAIGLSNPIQVEPAEDGYELIQGLRRLTAFRALRDETGQDIYTSIPAVVLNKGEELDALYRRMVDENMVRKDISFAEMARLARDYAGDPKTEAVDVDSAVALLFSSASKQKRSYIRAFAELLEQIGSVLSYPEAIPRALGLAVRRHLSSPDADLAALKVALISARTAQEELAVLRTVADERSEEGEGDNAQADTGQFRQSMDRIRQPKTTFQISGPQGAAKCTAAAGRLELRMDTDFSALDRRRLEEALRRFLNELG